MEIKYRRLLAVVFLSFGEGRWEEQNREEGEKKRKSLGRREKLTQKVRSWEKLAQKVGRREIYPPVAPPSEGESNCSQGRIPIVVFDNSEEGD